MAGEKNDNLEEEKTETVEEENKDTTEETEEENKPEGEGEGDGESDDDEDDDEGDEEEEEKIPEKFRGKSKGEIIKSYLELEQILGKRGISKEERQELKKAGVTRKDLENMEEIAKEVDAMDFSKMKPSEFVMYLLNIVDKRTESKAKTLYETADRVKQSVRTEIDEAKEKFPLLSTNTEYRELVVALINSEAAKGKTLGLVKACEKVNSLLSEGKNKVDKSKKEEDRKNKVVKTDIETPDAALGNKETEEEAVLKGLAQNRGNTILGGL